MIITMEMTLVQYQDARIHLFHLRHNHHLDMKFVEDKDKDKKDKKGKGKMKKIRMWRCGQCGQLNLVSITCCGLCGGVEVDPIIPDNQSKNEDKDVENPSWQSRINPEPVI